MSPSIDPLKKRIDPFGSPHTSLSPQDTKLAKDISRKLMAAILAQGRKNTSSVSRSYDRAPYKFTADLKKLPPLTSDEIAFRNKVAQNAFRAVEFNDIVRVKPRHMPLRQTPLKLIASAAQQQALAKLDPTIKKFNLANELIGQRQWLNNGVKVTWAVGTVAQAYTLYDALKKDGALQGKTFSFGTSSKKEMAAFVGGSAGGVLGSVIGGVFGTLVAKKPGFKIGSVIGSVALGALMNHAGRDVVSTSYRHTVKKPVSK